MLDTEKRTAFSLALVQGFRLLGLFMILPVFSLHGAEYAGATPVLIGLAIGMYGLTQGLFQLPFGFLSDRIGRKTVIVGGLVIFGIGSVVAAEADSIYQVIAGRALQGMGEIAAAVMALAADLTREEMRLRIMAIIGISIGASFMLSMVLGPIVAAQYGMRALFWLTAVFAVLGIFIVLFVTPKPLVQGFHRDAQVSIRDIGGVLADTELLKLGFGVFILHMVLSATFVVFPLVLVGELAVAENLHWQTYLPVFLLSAVFLPPMVLLAEKHGRSRAMFLVAIALLLLAEGGLALGGTYAAAFGLLLAYFVGINFLEAILPASVARVAPAGMKGTAMGLYSSAQFIGAFCGGLAGGFLLAGNELRTAFAWLLLPLAAWFVVAMTMRDPKPVRSRIVSLKSLEQDALRRFIDEAGRINGVSEIAIYESDRVAYLKVEKNFDERALQTLLAG